MVELEKEVCPAPDCKFPIGNQGCKDKKGGKYCRLGCAYIILKEEGIQSPIEEHFYSLKNH